jgi:hypothetical protein
VTHIEASIGDFLRGYVAGYWEAWDFANSTEGMELRNEAGSAPGSADASSPAPPLDPPAARPHGRSTRPDGAGGSSGSADSSLPAIRQAALPGDVEVAGELEAMFMHRGMVTALSDMARLLSRLGHIEAARLCLAAIDIERTP